MSDSELRLAERRGDTDALFISRVRARMPIPLNVPLNAPTPDGQGDVCHASSLEPASAAHVALLAAYAGSDLARQALGEWLTPPAEGVGGHPVWYPHVGRLGDAAGWSPNFSSWVAGLDRILGKQFVFEQRPTELFPPVIVSDEWCDSAHHLVNWGMGQPPCPDCNGGLTRSVSVPFRAYARALLSLDVSRLAAVAWASSIEGSWRCREQGTDLEAVFSAIEAWLACPCVPNKRAVVSSMDQGGLPSFARALDAPSLVGASLSEGLLESAALVGKGRFYSSICAAVRKMVGLG